MSVAVLLHDERATAALLVYKHPEYVTDTWITDWIDNLLSHADQLRAAGASHALARGRQVPSSWSPCGSSARQPACVWTLEIASPTPRERSARAPAPGSKTPRVGVMYPAPLQLRSSPMVQSEAGSLLGRKRQLEQQSAGCLPGCTGRAEKGIVDRSGG